MPEKYEVCIQQRECMHAGLAFLLLNLVNLQPCTKYAYRIQFYEFLLIDVMNFLPRE